jgi:hypothetical protein
MLEHYPAELQRFVGPLLVLVLVHLVQLVLVHLQHPPAT